MDVPQVLDLIVEAVQYCRRVKAMGMRSQCYSKALRELVHFLWERRGGKSKEASAQFRSKASVGRRPGKAALVYDHAIPFRYLQDELLHLADVTRASVGTVLNEHCVVVLVTREENVRLNRAGLGSKMPKGWNGVDPLARYAAVGIEVIPNSQL
jgi:hypothetical protein